MRPIALVKALFWGLMMWALIIAVVWASLSYWVVSQIALATLIVGAILTVDRIIKLEHRPERDSR